MKRRDLCGCQLALTMVWWFIAAPAPVVAQSLGAPARYDSSSVMALVVPDLAAGPRLDLHGFFDVSAHAGTSRTAARDSSSFGVALGQFDLYMNSRLSDRIAFLGELVVEGEGGELARIELERAHIRYSVADWAQITAGRTHSPLSYWNVVHHHGALLEPTTERPGPVEFEDAGGLLPLHAVGFELAGAVPAAWANLRYIASLSNGRGAEPGVIQTGSDRDREKALGLALEVSAGEVVPVAVGLAAQHDPMPPGPDGAIARTQEIVSAHAAVNSARVQLIGEYFVVRDREPSQRFQHRAWYAVVSAGAERWHPYMSMEHTRIDSADPYFANTLSTRQRAAAGLRFEIHPSNVIKLELRNTLQGGSRTHDLVLQTAFTF